jgi:hypothetical protein
MMGDGSWNYTWNANIHSQKDLDQLGIEGEYLGLTYLADDMYYSLMGGQYAAASKEGKAMQKIDEALTNYYYGQKAAREAPYSSEDISYEKATNFDIGEYLQKSALGLYENPYFTFDIEGGYVVYFKLPQGVKNSAKFEGFNNVTKGIIRGQGNRGAGNLKSGIPLNFKRYNTPGIDVPDAAKIIFYSTQSANAFYSRYSSLFKGR